MDFILTNIDTLYLLGKHVCKQCTQIMVTSWAKLFRGPAEFSYSLVNWASATLYPGFTHLGLTKIP